MNIYESLRTALTALSTNKMRAFLTMLGIIIGVAAVIALSSLGQGVQTMVGENIESLGANMLTIMAQQPDDASSRSILTTSDAEALADPLNVPALAAVAPQTSGNLYVTRGEESARVSVVATVPEYESVRSMNMAMGSFLTSADLQDRARVSVLGWGAYEELFTEGEYPLGEVINLEGTRFRVVGVLEEKGGMSAMTGEDDSVYVPMTTGLSRLFRERTLSGDYPVGAIYVTVVDESQTDTATRQITDLLRERHRLDNDDEDDFGILSQQQVMDISSEITGVLTLFLGAIAGISLFVGGIGIMNIMLVTVTERTREIGIRKAVGATSTNILVQFLIEALVLTMGGGLIGIALGVTTSRVLSNFMNVTPEVTAGIVSLAAGVACIVGLVFGTYPAMRAARLHPIEALRHE